MRVAFAVLALFATQALGCSCGGNNDFLKTPYQAAKDRFDAADVVFEGTPVRFELKGSVFDLREGDPVPGTTVPGIGLMWGLSDNYPHMKISFRVIRAYKGVTGSEISVLTGLGGGDCGSRFATGLKYLIYTGSPAFVSICGPQEWIPNGEEDAALRYLRNEKPVAARPGCSTAPAARVRFSPR